MRKHATRATVQRVDSTRSTSNRNSLLQDPSRYSYSSTCSSTSAVPVAIWVPLSTHTATGSMVVFAVCLVKVIEGGFASLNRGPRCCGGCDQDSGRDGEGEEYSATCYVGLPPTWI